MKKCGRCNTYFSEGARDLVCSYHISPWLDLHAPGKGAARIGVWGCCKEIEKDAPGCVHGVHIEDKFTSEILRKFEVIAVKGTREEALELLDIEFLQKNLGHTRIHLLDHNKKNNMNNININTNTNNSNINNNETIKKAYATLSSGAAPTTFARPKPNEIPDQEGFLKHPVHMQDTLAGIALRYNTTVGTIKQINKLFSNNDLYKVKILLVPDPDYTSSLSPIPSHSYTPSSLSPALIERKRARQVSSFAAGEGICREEALFYLSDNEWNPILARASFNDDVEWAKSEWKKGKGRIKLKIKEWMGDADVQTVAVVACGAIVILLCIVL